MGAAVDIGVDTAILTAGENYRRFTHVGLHEITGRADLRFMPKKEPGFSENTPLFQCVNTFIGPAAPAYERGVLID